MRDFLCRIPPAAGCVGLGFMGLGTLLRSYGAGYLWVCTAVGLLCLLPVLARLLLPGEGKKIGSDLLALSTLAGSPMAWMFFAAALKTECACGWAVWIWALAVAWHLAILILFSYRLITARPGCSAVRGSWLLVYVGIAAAPITSAAFSAQGLGRALLIFAALSAAVILPLVYNADRRAEIPAAQRPLFCISTAPVSICLVGYLRAFDAPAPKLVTILAVLSILLYVPALIRAARHLRGPFAPTLAALTFPFVISASALKQSAAFLSLVGQPALKALILLETVVAAALCVYVFLRFVRQYAKQ